MLAEATRNKQARKGVEAKMKTNMATWDRAARALVGILLIILTLTGTIGVWGWIGIVPIVTAAIGSCPAYSIFGFSTCKKGSCTQKPE